MPAWIASLITGDMTPGERQNFIRILFWGAVSFHIAWACGLLPGVQGFAVASEVDGKIAQAVEPIKVEVREIDRKLSRVEREVIAARIATLEKSLFDLRKAQCTAIARENPEAVEFYGRQIQGVRAEYYAATAREYQAPTCAEVGTE
jgi:hypothetical protein